ncbi:MAG: DUF6077 domain-containing protein [Lachnospiraceae bacterium]
MAFVLALTLSIVPILLGTAVTSILREEEPSMAHTYLMGFVTLLLTFTGIAYACKAAELPFTSLCILYSCFLVFVCGSTCVICYHKLQHTLMIHPFRQKKMTYLLYLILGILFCLEIGKIVSGDTMVQGNRGEVADTILPMIHHIRDGNSLMEGTPMYVVMYAYFAETFSIDTQQMLYLLLPVWMLFVSFLVYQTWAEHLFVHHNVYVCRQKSACFLLLYALLLFFGDTLFTTIPYHLFYEGWQGSTIIIAILIPFALGLWMQNRQSGILPFLLSIAGIFCITGFGFLDNIGAIPLANISMREIAKTMLHVNDTINGFSQYQALYVVSLLYLYVNRSQATKKLLYYNLIVLAIVWNPLLVKGLLYLLPQLNNYWPFLWLLPTLGVTAYVGTETVERIESKVRTWRRK